MSKETHTGEPRELDFEDKVSTRTGEPLTRDEQDELTATRARTAGLTGGDVPGETVDNEPTADDLSPETLLHEEGNEGSLGDDEAADGSLRERPASRIGAGHGKDEAELARESDEPE